MEKILKVPASQLLTHHGDTVIQNIGTLPKNVKKIKPRPLALGETSGHRHIAVAERVDLIDFYEDESGNTYLVNKSEMKIRHQLENQEWTGEHHTIVLDPSVYKISIQRVKDVYTKNIEQVKD